MVLIKLTPAATIATTVLTDAADAMTVAAADPTTVKVTKMMMGEALMGEALEAMALAASEISITVEMVVATAAATTRLVMTMGATTTAMAPATAACRPT